jgi:hypothetical protein
VRRGKRTYLAPAAHIEFAIAVRFFLFFEDVNKQLPGEFKSLSKPKK